MSGTTLQPGAALRPLAPRDAEACDAIVAGLPDWFGDEGGIARCARSVRRDPGLVAVDADGRVEGFLTVVRHFPETAEISWMAVRHDRRGAGVGRALVAALREGLEREGVRLLLVKTLSSRRPDAGYAATRAFYRACGFVPAQELDIWGPENPCLLLALTLDAAS